MNRSKKIIFLLTVLALVLSAGMALGLDAGNKGDYRISAGQLKEMLGDPNLIIIDVRDPVSWTNSNTKILGAVREDSQNTGAWAGKYGKNKIFVFYCA
ncbi:MAG: hypothetical protein RBS57_06670 [Desulforhabdus sp.]|jgi:hypothetical protein|nr:hypothetical protein [Desulforhabdus sp.]